MSRYSKPYLRFEEQLALLKRRGLIVTNDEAALSCLQRIGYYRLSAYWYPFRQKTEASGSTPVPRSDNFYPGVTLEQVLALYVFDKRLRLLILDAIERVEVALRVDIAYRLGARDPFAHTNPALLDGGFTKKADPRTGHTRYQAWLGKYRQSVSRSKEDFVRHHRQKYGEPFPIWIAVELWEFGMLSTFYQGMRMSDRDAIAARYAIPDGRVMQSWLRSVNFIRNVAAHHSRLWNKNLVDQPRLPLPGQVAGFDPILGYPSMHSRVFVVLCILLHFMRVVSPRSAWLSRLRSLLANFPDASGVSLEDMGFPADWKTHYLWMSPT